MSQRQRRRRLRRQRQRRARTHLLRAGTGRPGRGHLGEHLVAVRLELGAALGRVRQGVVHRSRVSGCRGRSSGTRAEDAASEHAVVLTLPAPVALSPAPPRPQAPTDVTCAQLWFRPPLLHPHLGLRPPPSALGLGPPSRDWKYGLPRDTPAGANARIGPATSRRRRDAQISAHAAQSGTGRRQAAGGQPGRAGARARADCATGHGRGWLAVTSVQYAGERAGVPGPLLSDTAGACWEYNGGRRGMAAG